MKKQILIIAAALMLFSCNKTTDNINHTNKLNFDELVKVVEIDSCEYVIYDNYQGGGIEHKGNCKNH